MTAPSSHSFVARRRVEFRDTDAAGIMHFSTFFTYMEQVEHEFLRSLGKSVMPSPDEDDGEHISWPRVSAACNYRMPLRFEDEFEVHLVIRRMGTKSIEFACAFWHAGKLCAEGSLTAVCCRIHFGKRPESIPIPDDFRRLLEPYVAEESVAKESD